MIVSKVRGLYFSPTGTTKLICETIAQSLAVALQVDCQMSSYTFPFERETFRPVEANELIVWASPVYAGRVPNKTLSFLPDVLPDTGNLILPVAVYGGRSYDQALWEMCSIAKDKGLQVVEAWTALSRHAFAHELAKGHPTISELADLGGRAEILGRTIAQPEYQPAPMDIPWNQQVATYYKPLKEDGTPANFLKAKPVVDEGLCIVCGRCVRHCPMGTIQKAGNKIVFEGVCIKCQACITRCPEGALAFEDEDFLSHQRMLNRLAPE